MNKIDNPEIIIIFDNRPFDPGFVNDWGFSAFIKTGRHNILFDTGKDADILISNMKTAGVDPHSFDALIISHNHYDHTGGMERLLEMNKKLDIFLPCCFPQSFDEKHKTDMLSIKRLKDHSNIYPGVFLTGAFEGSIPEQGIILNTSRGLILITGCAHPDIGTMAETTMKNMETSLFLIAGGFHMKNKANHEIETTIKKLKKMNIKKVMPSHCTGESAIAVFKEYFDNGYIDSGAGKRYDLSDI